MRRQAAELTGGALALCVLLTCGGCTSARQDLRHRLESYDPADRIAAIVEVAQKQDAEFVPALIDRLDDEDVAVRMYAVIALERLTGTRRGFSYAAPPAQRRKAVTAWRQWLSGNRDEQHHQGNQAG